MDYAEFQDALKAAGLTVAGLARLLKQHPNSITNYKHLGYIPSHLAVIAAMARELAKHGVPLKTVVEGVDLRPKAPRGRKFATVSASPNRKVG